MSTCFFIGHRECPQELYPQLKAAVETCITMYDVKEFMVGQYGEFDRMAAKCVLDAKRSFPQITFTLLLPYHPAQRKIELPDGFDASLYPPGQETVPKRLAIVRANHYAINHADCLIAYVWHTASNAQNLLEHARKREKCGQLRIILLGKPAIPE